MAYNELIKNFSRIRDYMKEFYVYGLREAQARSGTLYLYGAESQQ